MPKAARLTDTGSGHDCFPPPLSLPAARTSSLMASLQHVKAIRLRRTAVPAAVATESIHALLQQVHHPF